MNSGKHWLDNHEWNTPADQARSIAPDGYRLLPDFLPTSSKDHSLSGDRITHSWAVGVIAIDPFHKDEPVWIAGEDRISGPLRGLLPINWRYSHIPNRPVHVVRYAGLHQAPSDYFCNALLASSSPRSNAFPGRHLYTRAPIVPPRQDDVGLE